MTLVVMVFLGLLVAAGSLVGPVAMVELRQGREAFQRVSLEGASEAALAQAVFGGWVGAAVGAPPRTVVPIPAVVVRSRLVVTLEAEALVADIWLVHGRASLVDQAGNPIAAGRVGWLVRVGVFPPDTVLRARLIGRPWVPGFE